MRMGSRVTKMKTITSACLIAFSLIDSASFPARLEALQETAIYTNVLVKPLEVHYPYKISNSINEKIPNIEEKIVAFCEGAKNAEIFFGFEVGDKVKRITLHNHPRIGVAFFSMPDGMAFHSLLLNSEQDLRTWSFHETVHLVDYLTNFQLSNEEFDKLYIEIRERYPEFFIEVSEHNFLEELNIHAQNNREDNIKLRHAGSDSKELVASLVSSLQEEHISDKLKIQSKEFLVYYQKCLEILKANLLAQSDIVNKDAPIHARINEVLEITKLVILRAGS